ncbi:unnamed protein product [Cylicocyclus nassatus]|uniref:Tc1-like transposase DDE domain-containing protein n=1 Tax=Cylicocyclus nassatus TaxID=53992 RepID=A0AA36GCK9_CYLNA|nr:unnamed protein product [Cylicocyclus nassatus]
MAAADYLDIILPLHRTGETITNIHKKVNEKNPSISIQSIRKFIKDFHAIKPLTRKVSRGAANEGVIRAEVTRLYRQDNSVTAISISNHLRTRGIHASTTLVKRYRDRLGFKRNTTKYCHMIRDVNKEKRVDFCLDMMADKERFLDCVFTDESTFQLGNSTKYCYVEPGNTAGRLRSRAKHPAKLHVWGGISYRGTTALAIFKGTVRMDSKLYCEILEECFLSFSEGAYYGCARLVQDNAPAHKSAYTMERLQRWGVRTVDWPAEYPIELVWGSMKGYMRTQSFRTIDQLESAIRDYWSKLTPEICQKYIEGIQWRMPLIVEARGGNIIEKNPNKKRVQNHAQPSDSDSNTEENDWF